MRRSDLLEVIGIIALAAAAYVGVGLPVALAVLGAGLIYQAHCIADAPLRKLKPQPEPPREVPQPVHTTSAAGGKSVTNLTCEACGATFVRGLAHSCDKKKAAT
jgi:hypothetical protein